ncbi:Abi family protein [Streptomyces sp. UG1]|uniref:Abi family protein n=1 Tax=Streptomyces sp. UG1 TaxID=3417652 RepID=UPI003CEED4EC
MVAVEAWSFGTLSKAIERGAGGTLADAVATSVGVARAGFAYRVRSLVYLRNRCAHHSRLWHHSVLYNHAAGSHPLDRVLTETDHPFGDRSSRPPLPGNARHWPWTDVIIDALARLEALPNPG